MYEKDVNDEVLWSGGGNWDAGRARHAVSHNPNVKGKQNYRQHVALRGAHCSKAKGKMAISTLRNFGDRISARPQSSTNSSFTSRVTKRTSVHRCLCLLTLKNIRLHPRPQQKDTNFPISSTTFSVTCKPDRSQSSVPLITGSNTRPSPHVQMVYCIQSPQTLSETRANTKLDQVNLEVCLVWDKYC
jgi:hypothetical protein